MRTVIFENHTYVWLPSIGKYACLDVLEGEVPAQRVYHASLTLTELRHFAEFLQAEGLKIVNERGEWTADFVDYGTESRPSPENADITVTYVSRPTSLILRDGHWSYEGGTTTLVRLPPSGWVISGPGDQLYHPVTGTPWRTAPNPDKHAAVSNFAYFWRNELGTGLRAVSRECERVSLGAFDFAAFYEPNFTHDNCGSRPTLLPKDTS